MSRLIDGLAAGKSADADVDDEEDDLEGDAATTSKDYKYKASIVHVIMSEDSLKQRRKLTRGAASLKQVETLHVLCCGTLCLPDRAGKHYSGSNKGTAIGPVTLANPDEEWSATVKEKRLLYGKRWRIAVGGKTDGTSAEKRHDTDREPVFFWSYPHLFYDEILHRFFGRAVFDMTPGAGCFGEVCLKQRAGYFCFAMTEAHAACLQERLELAALRYMTESGNTHYQARCAEALGIAPEAKAKAKTKAKSPVVEAEPQTKATKAKRGEDGPARPKKKAKNGGAAEGEAGAGSEGGEASSSWDLSAED